MGKRFSKILKRIIKEVLYIIYPPNDRCISCGEDFIGLCPICKSEIKRVKENNNKYYSYAYYNGVIKNIILNFKYKKIFLAGDILSEFLLEIIKENNIEADGIFFVPASKKSVKKRGFNQCEILAKKVGEFTSIPVYKSLVKIKETKEQKTLSKYERKDNIKDAFIILKSEEVKDKRIILIDDVITTGATIKECEKVLREFGAKEIKILTISKNYI